MYVVAERAEKGWKTNTLNLQIPADFTTFKICCHISSLNQK